jgi:hypothetical protein
MKTTNLFLAACALFVCTCSFAQTKEATIEWLKPKLLEWTSFSTCTDLVFEIKDCEIILKGKQNGYSFRCVWNTNFKEMTHTSAESAYWVTYDYEGGYSATDKSHSTDKPYKSTSHHLLKANTPPEMAKRIETAIRHLATFCSKYQKSEDEPF